MPVGRLHGEAEAVRDLRRPRSGTAPPTAAGTSSRSARRSGAARRRTRGTRCGRARPGRSRAARTDSPSRRCRRAGRSRRAAPDVGDEGERRSRPPATCGSRATSSKTSPSHGGNSVSPSTSSVDLGQHELVGERERGRVDLGAADHEHLRRVPGEVERLVERPGALGAVAVHFGLRVTTMLRRPGRGRKRSGSESHVRRPITTGWPGRELAEERHVLRAAARGRCRRDRSRRRARRRRRARPSHCDRRADRRVVRVADDLEVLEGVVEDRVGAAPQGERRDTGTGRGRAASRPARGGCRRCGSRRPSRSSRPARGRTAARACA